MNGKDREGRRSPGVKERRRGEGAQNRRFAAGFVFLGILLLTLFVWNIGSGSVGLSPKEVLRLLLFKEGEQTALHIIWKIRLPRILSAILLGGALSVSGFLLQTFFHNPIAGPFVLGISSGAKLVVALCMIYSLSEGRNLGAAGMVLAAFLGSMISMGFVLVVSRRVKSMSMLVICGVMVSYICSAITDFAVTFAQDSNIVNLHNWALGSFSATSWRDLQICLWIEGITLVVVFFLSKQIMAYQLGEAYAIGLGIHIPTLRVLLILTSSILSACVTAFAGPISFVGIAVPHLVKNLFHTSKPICMIPACFLGGAVFCLFCDLIARTLFSPTELSISSVTAVFGAPIVIIIMIRRQSQR